MKPWEIRKAAREMDRLFAEEKKMEGKYEQQVEEESKKIDELVAEVKNAITDGRIEGRLLRHKITRLTGCTITTAERIKEIIEKEC